MSSSAEGGVALAPVAISADGSALLAHQDPDSSLESSGSVRFNPAASGTAGDASAESSEARREALLSFFDVRETAAFIARHGVAARRVALQFPDEWLPQSAQVLEEIKQEVARLEAGANTAAAAAQAVAASSSAAVAAAAPAAVLPPLQLFILADTSYGSCCVDEVAAQHANCDLIVHYGFSCLSRTRRLPVRYVFGRARDLDVERAAQTILDDPGWGKQEEDSFSFSSFSAPPAAPAADTDANEPPVLVLVLYSLEYAHTVSSGALPRAFTRALEQRQKADNKKQPQFVVSVARVETEHGHDGMVAPATAQPASVSQCATGSCACKAAAPAAAPAGCCGAAGSSCCSSTAPTALVSSTPAAATVAASSPALPPLVFSSAHPAGGAESLGPLRSFVLNGYRFAFPRALVADVASFRRIQVVWLGPDSDHRLLANAMLNYNAHAFHLFHPATNRLRRDVRPLSRTLARRFFLMEKAKSASIVGILVGTLGVANYLAVLRGLQAALRAAGKKSYLFVMGKLNEPKLSNFAEIDLFVLVACPLSVMFDGRDIATGGLRADVVTPFEMMMALRGDEWTGEYDTTFDSVLKQTGRTDGEEGDSEEEEQDEDEDTAAPTAPAAAPVSDDLEHGVRFDPISGKIKAALPSHVPSGAASAASSGGGELIQQGDQQLVRTANGELVALPSARDHFLTARSFMGLEVRQSHERNDEVAPIEAGLDGIARRYGTVKLEADPKETQANQ